MKIKTYWNGSNKYIFKLSFVFFLTAWVAFLSLTTSHSVMHSIYIYIYAHKYIFISTLSLYMGLLAGDQVRMNVCLLVRLFLLVIFFFLFAHSTQSVKHQVVLYIYSTHIHCFMMKAEVLKNEKKKDCSIIYLFFLSFFFLLANSQQTETYVLNAFVFRTLVLWDDVHLYAHLICFYSILSFLFYSNTAQWFVCVSTPSHLSSSKRTQEMCEKRLNEKEKKKNDTERKNEETHPNRELKERERIL